MVDIGMLDQADAEATYNQIVLESSSRSRIPYTLSGNTLNLTMEGESITLTKQ